jgi:hypothetical protein
MQHLFIFSKTRFISELLEKVLSSSEFRPFALDQTAEIEFFLNDMKPQKIILDTPDFSVDELKQLSESLKVSQNTYTLYLILRKNLRAQDASEYINIFTYPNLRMEFIERPFSPFEFLNQLKTKH